jgi:hypothetical protein
MGKKSEGRNGGRLMEIEEEKDGDRGKGRGRKRWR